jgi:HJR/Mrr/RecB family endonuclease
MNPRGTSESGRVDDRGVVRIPEVFLNGFADSVFVRLEHLFRPLLGLELWHPDTWRDELKATPPETLIEHPYMRKGVTVPIADDGSVVVPPAYWRVGGFSADVVILGQEVCIAVQDATGWEIARQRELLEFQRLASTVGLGQIEQDTRALGSRDVAAVEVVNAKLLDLVAREPDRLRALAPREFEEIVADLFRSQGFTVILTPPSDDRGVDLYVVEHHEFGVSCIVVDCKRYHAGLPVGIALVRQLNGVIFEQQADAGMIVTTSRFTRGARKLASAYPRRLALADFRDLEASLTDGRCLTRYSRIPTAAAVAATS